MIPFRVFVAEANWMYHGTPHHFDQIKVNTNDHMIDRAIGIHFAADDAIASKFMVPLYGTNGNPPAAATDKALYRTSAPPRSRTLIVPQKTYHFPKYAKKATDQSAVGAFVASTVFDSRPDLFVQWIVRSRNITAQEGERIYKALKNGDNPHYETGNTPSLKSFVANYDSGMFMLLPEHQAELIKAFDTCMKNRGIDALVYDNTSPMETKDITGVPGHSPKCYILLTHAIDRYPLERLPFPTVGEA